MVTGQGYPLEKGPGEFLSGESNRPLTPILLKSIAIHLAIFIAILLQEYLPSRSWQKVVYDTTNLYHDTPPICIAILLQKYQGQGSLGFP